MAAYILRKSRKRKKTISLHINSQSEIVVSAPFFTKDSEINRFIQEKQNWIQKTIQKQKELQLQETVKQYVSGEEFFYLGKPYPLEVFFQRGLPAGLVFWGNRFYLNCEKGAVQGRHYFSRWYKTSACKYIHERINRLGESLRLLPGKIRISSACHRWGSCSEENNLSFSFRLMMAPPLVIDYVIIHELMHIKEKNHSKQFWNLVAAVMPEYKLHRQWLRENGHKFIL